MAFGLQTYDDASIREDLLSILRDVSPNTDNYFISNLAKGPKAASTIHEWVTYNTARPTSVTNAIEGAAASYDDLSAPARSNNRTAILTENVRVSRTERKMAVATGEDPYAFQKAEALKRLKAKMEWNIINGAYASGISGVARGLAGIDGCISTNITARSSGTSFSELELNDIMNQSWDAVGSMYVADLLVCPMNIKRIISGFTTNTRNVQAAEKRLTSEVQVYDSQVGKSVMIIPHKDVRAVAGSLTVYALNESTFRLSFLDEPFWEELAKDGDRDNGQYVTEFTLESLAQRASVKRTGYVTTIN